MGSAMMSPRLRQGRWLAAVLALAALVPMGAAQADATLDRIQARQKVVIGVTLPGGRFGSIDPATQQPAGFTVELARDVARQLGVTLETVHVSAANRVQFLLQGKVDILVATMALTEERAAILSYAPTPYYETGGVGVVPRDSAIQRWEDVRDQPVCLSQGSNFAKPLATEYGADVKGFKTSAESLLALRGGNCVTAVHDGTNMYPLLASHPEWKDYRLITPELIPSPWVAWARKGETDTVARLDAIVQGWHRTGWLIDTEQRLGITPPSPLLAALHRQATAAAPGGTPSAGTPAAGTPAAGAPNASRVTPRP